MFSEKQLNRSVFVCLSNSYLTFALFQQLGVELPAEKDESESEEFLNQVHHALLEVEVITGDLVCPETGRKFPIKNGIPNMLCNEDEI